MRPDIDGDQTIGKVSHACLEVWPRFVILSALLAARHGARLAAVGYCQPDGTFITTLANLGQWLGEMAACGEAVCVDGLATRVQHPRGWANQKVLYDAKRHTHTAQGLAVSTIHGDLLWVDGGWPAAATSTSSSNWQGCRVAG